ncbi:MAG TPA: ATPase, T2SS/T4P/T4SS family [Methylophilaceae bacterium]|nr:ATPase, T2SS/T4P/T4SS family [Methylophilaceae bacterium]
MSSVIDVLAKLPQARDLSLQSGHRLIEALEEVAGLTANEFMAALGAALRYPVLTMEELYRLVPDFETIGFSEASQRECLAFRDEQGASVIVFADAFSENLPTWAQGRAPGAARWCLAHHADIAAYLSRYEDGLKALDAALPSGASIGGGMRGEELSLVSITESTSPVVKLVHSTLYDALKAEASDIHLETTAAGLTIKYRLDGVLVQIGSVGETAMASQMISRIKVMSELDISERRVPQDGRFRVGLRGRDIDFRVSIMPSIHGEDAVIRILDKQALTDHLRGLRLDYLGFDERSIAEMRQAFHAPYGMILVTGPTGSGKTTTLYAAISEVNNGQDKIITIEDPVEYQLSGVLQIPVNEKKGLTFARGLRSILRHDPDKIMVGEIRDPETAQIAVQSALTGHLVFTTVHANNVFDVIGRFLNMEVDSYSFVSALNVVLAQRLVRLNCPQCSAPDAPSAELLAESRLSSEDVAGMQFSRGRGCGACRGTGYKGRKAVSEILTLNDEIRELIVSRAPIRQVKEAARHAGTRYLRESALELVRGGETTLQEVNRVTAVV